MITKKRIFLLSVVFICTACGNDNQSSSSVVDAEHANARITTRAIEKLTENEHALWDRGAGKDLVWASFTLRDAQDKFVTGRTRDAFTLTETLLDASGNVVDQAPVQFRDPPYTFYQFNGPGFWERTVTQEKLDILFIVDGTGTMSDEIAAIRSEMHGFVDRLQANRVDFRMAAINDEQVPGAHYIMPHDESAPFPFDGVMHVDDIHTWIDSHINTSGENWEPTTGYDSLMLATTFDWRTDADVRKVIVLITDTLPQSVYGTFWSLDSTAANLAGAELALKDKGFEVYFSQPETEAGVMDHPDMDRYTDPKFNPKAGCKKLSASQWDCGFNSLGTRIRWPFKQTDISLASNQTLSDSKYYFAWQSSISGSNIPAGHSVRITLATDDPDSPGTSIEKSFSYTPVLETAQLTLNATNVHGEIVDDATIDVFYEMGDRRVKMYTGYSDANDPGKYIYPLLPVQDYRVHTSYGWGDYGYDILFYQGSKYLTLTSGGVSFDMQLASGAIDSELSKARGLVQDLDRWGVTEKPFSEFADDTETWLNTLEAGGIDWKDMERIKRFYVAMSGYVNASGYAEVEAERITQDFAEVLHKFRDIIERIRGLSKDSKIALSVSTVEAMARLDVTSLGEIVAGEATVEALKTFAEDELVPKVISKVIEHIPGNVDDAHKVVLTTMINSLILGHWDDWPQLLNTIGSLAMDDAMDAVQAKVLSEISDQTLAGLNVDPTVRDAIKTVMTEFSKQGFNDGFSSALQAVQAPLAAVGSEEQVLYLLDEGFGQLHTQLAAGPVRDFVLPITGLLMRSAVQQNEINDDVVIKLLAHYFTHQIIVKPYFGDPVASKLDDALVKAKAFTPDITASSDWDRHVSMSGDFADFRLRESPNMDDLNDDTWKKLARQDAIDDFSQVLSVMSDTLLPLLQTLFTGLCSSGYPSCAIAKDTKDFVAVLDAVGLMTKVLELGLKTEDLTHLNGDVAFINNVLLVN